MNNTIITNDVISPVNQRNILEAINKLMNFQEEIKTNDDWEVNQQNLINLETILFKITFLVTSNWLYDIFV